MTISKKTFIKMTLIKMAITKISPLKIKHMQYSSRYQLFGVKRDKMRQTVTETEDFRLVNYSFNTGNIHSKIGQIVT